MSLYLYISIYLYIPISVNLYIELGNRISLKKNRVRKCHFPFSSQWRKVTFVSPIHQGYFSPVFRDKEIYTDIEI